MLYRHVAGALACGAEVDVWLASGAAGPAGEWEGALRVRRFPVRPGADRRRALVYREIFGAEHPGSAFADPWTGELTRLVAAELPEWVAREIVRTAGGESPELLEALAACEHDVVVFCGYRSASTIDGLPRVAGRARTVVVPALREEPELCIPACREALGAADRVLVATPGEAALARREGVAEGRVREVGLALRVHELARRSEPAGYGEHRYVVVVDDWSEPPSLFEMAALSERIRRDFEGTEIGFVGRGADRLPESFAERRRPAVSRTDLWRWMSRAIAVCDPRPYRAIGLETLEALACGAPVLVPDRPGASREHAERSGGGLWYEGYAELRGCLEMLLGDEELRAGLAERGRRYVEQHFSDPDRFVGRVVDSVMGEA